MERAPPAGLDLAGQYTERGTAKGPAPGGFKGSSQHRLGLKQSSKTLGWGFPAERFAWPGVELGGDGGQIGAGVAPQVGALGEVLAQQPVGRSYVCQAAGARSTRGIVVGWVAAWMRR